MDLPSVVASISSADIAERILATDHAVHRDRLVLRRLVSAADKRGLPTSAAYKLR